MKKNEKKTKKKDVNRGVYYYDCEHLYSEIKGNCDIEGKVF